MTKTIRFLNAVHVLILAGVLLGAYGVQFMMKEQPCPLCMLQRLSMMGIAVMAICNLKFGIRPAHYGVAILSAMLGAGVSLRQIALHICPQFPTFGEPLLGLDLYWWAFIVFSCSIGAIAIFLALFKKEQEKPMHLNWFEKGVFVLMALIIIGNVITTFLECGLGACKG